MKKYDLEDRLVQFASSILDFIDKLPKNPQCLHLGNQLMRSGTAPALLYGEAQGAESKKDFIHKMRIGLKELRETHVCLKIIVTRNYVATDDQLKKLLIENDELLAIFVTSIKTASLSDLKNEGQKSKED